MTMAIERDNTASTSTIGEMLEARGITSGRKLAKHTEAQAVIYFLLRDAEGHGNDPRAELHFRVTMPDQDPKWMVRQYRPDTRHGSMSVRDMRMETTERAQDDAGDLLGLNEWTKAPFSNCWLPVESMNRMRQELGLDQDS